MKRILFAATLVALVLACVGSAQAELVFQEPTVQVSQDDTYMYLTWPPNVVWNYTTLAFNGQPYPQEFDHTRFQRPPDDVQIDIQGVAVNELGEEFLFRTVIRDSDCPTVFLPGQDGCGEERWEKVIHQPTFWWLLCEADPACSGNYRPVPYCESHSCSNYIGGGSTCGSELTWSCTGRECKLPDGTKCIKRCCFDWHISYWVCPGCE